MLYCNGCGQCIHISDESFYEIRNISGWEKNLIDPINGEYEDCADSETTDSEHENFECPFCSGTNVSEAPEDSVSKETAEALRQAYIEEAEKARIEREKYWKRRKRASKQSDPSRQWDLSKNIARI